MKLKLLLPVVAILFFLIFSVWFVAYKTTISSDMQQFLPERAANSQAIKAPPSVDPLNILNIINESNSGLFLISIRGGTMRQRTKASIQLRKKLLSDKQFIFVNNGKNLLPLKDRSLLKKYRYLLTEKNDGATTFSQKEFSQALMQRYQELRSPLAGIVKKTFREDPTAEVRFILKQWQVGKQPNKTQGVWSAQDGKSVLLVAAVDINGADINKQQWAINKINLDFNAIHTANLDIVISGMGVFAVQAREKIKSDSKRVSLIASVAVLLLIFWAFRSLWYVFLTGLPLFSAILGGIVATQLIFNSVHGITLAFGLTLIGVALDYPVHVFSHLTNNENIRKSIKNIWPTLRLGVLTTCLGFFALTQTNFSGLAQLGVFAISGLLTAAIITRFVLPVLLQLKANKVNVIVPGWVVTLSSYGVSFKLSFVMISFVAVSILFLIFPIKWESDLAKLSPISVEQFKIDAQLRRQLNTDDLVNVAVVRGDNSNDVIYKTEKLKNFLNSLVERHLITGFRAPDQLLPSIETQLLRQKNLPEKTQLESMVFAATQNSPFRKNSFAAFIKDVDASRELAPLTMLQLKGTLLAKQLSPMLLQTNDAWLGIVRFIGVKDSAALEQAIRQLNNSAVSFVNIKKASQSIIDEFRNEAINLIGIGLLVIFITLLVSLKDSRRLTRVSFTVAMAIAFDILLLNVFGQALSLFHLVSLLLVLGLGLDYSLFFTRQSEDRAAREKTVYGILVCFGSTALVFGMLATSSIPVLSAIGLTVFLGVSLSFLFAILFSRAE
ncbi:FIG021862: membrane protein, exporter [hydrothermal vent metagenome]|uniref:FIG021862: membrane protein, exporter n=1 Tax=hydrothermal vent metagenome TaxID=652676 RepID=A0A3B0ZTS2_9ZZZZ